VAATATGMLVLALVTSAVVHAAVTMRAPAGWVATTEGEASSRARAWFADQPEAKIIRVYTTSGRDAFAETLALVELPGAFDAARGDAAELDRAMSGLPGFAAATATWTRDESSSAPRLVARWRDTDIAYRAELVASGESRTLLVGASLASEAVLYDRVFDETSASLEGAESPRTAFDRGAWRLRVLVTSLIAFAAAVGVAMWRRPFGAGARDIGRVAAVVIVVVSLVGAKLTSSAMDDHADALRLAGVSGGTLAAEAVTWGLLAAILTWVLGVWLGRSDGPVASAPLRGAFADRSSASLVSVPMIPKLPPRTDASATRRHPDGASRLEQATSPPAVGLGGGLAPVDASAADPGSRG
jgi:hypothetical protein